MKSITLDNIKKFDENYRSDSNNKIIENAIKNVGINDFCLNGDVVNSSYNVFNIELPKSKIYDQDDSFRCWAHAGINLIKDNIAENLNVDPNEYALSINYIAFLDKLEKSNYIYNLVIENDNFDLEKEIKNLYLSESIYEGGYFSFFRSIINKYGIVPEEIMPDVKSSKKSSQLTKIISEKVKKDVFKLLKARESGDDLYSLKQKMLDENYSILSKCLGELPIKFDYEYKNKDGECVKLTGITPNEFKDKYMTIDLNDFVEICNVPMYNKEYNKLYKKRYTQNVYGDSDFVFLNMPVDVLKNLAVLQLKDKTPVCFGCCMKKMRDYEIGIMDSNLYNYKDVFGYEPLTKEEGFTLYDIDFGHFMLITGVHIEDEKTIRWKVEDSYGSSVHKNGYYVMNDNFFDEFGCEVVINKKYLSKEQLKLFEQDPILFDMIEPM